MSQMGKPFFTHGPTQPGRAVKSRSTTIRGLFPHPLCISFAIGIPNAMYLLRTVPYPTNDHGHSLNPLTLHNGEPRLTTLPSGRGAFTLGMLVGH